MYISFKGRIKPELLKDYMNKNLSVPKEEVELILLLLTEAHLICLVDAEFGGYYAYSGHLL
jgi:hypothetical protein